MRPAGSLRLDDLEQQPLADLDQPSPTDRRSEAQEDAALHRARSCELAAPCRYSKARWALVAAIVTSMVVTMILGTVGKPFGHLWRRFEHNSNGQPININSGDNMTELFGVQPLGPSASRPRAALVILARDDDLEGVLLSMSRLEARFNNSQHRYPYVFLNNGPFSTEFRDATTNLTAAPTLYGEIPEEHWSYPSWVPQEKAAAAREQMARDGVLYGSRESYHHMCRYFSGFFYHHPLLKDFDFYWRVEPDVHYYCNLDYDPFVLMEQKGIKYGFVITVLEGPKTIPTLWDETREFMRRHPQLIPKDNLLDFVTTRGGEYNLCHFWSNFELGDLRFFRSRAYEEYFKHLDKAGGFFYERWGDAPVHSLAAVMLLNSSQIHHFGDIGYRHNSFTNCPAKLRNQCDCDAMKSVDFHSPLNSFGQCHSRWKQVLRDKAAAQQ